MNTQNRPRWMFRCPGLKVNLHIAPTADVSARILVVTAPVGTDNADEQINLFICIIGPYRSGDD
jgi:hypothetical protein